MTKEELAAMLNGREYGSETTRADELAAKAAGLIVAFGASDDLLETRGACSDELGAYQGGEFKLSIVNGHLKFIEERDDEDDLIEAGWQPPRPVLTITAKWSPADPEASWLITSDAPFAPFDIMEDGELYCRGAVIDTRTLT